MTVQAPPPSKSDRRKYINQLSAAEARAAGIRYHVAAIRPLEELPFLEDALLNRITSKPPNFQWRKNILIRETGLSSWKVTNALQTLKEKGYLRIRPIHRLGRFRGWLWEATQVAHQWADSEITTKPVILQKDGIQSHCSPHENIVLEEYNLSQPSPILGEDPGDSISSPGEDLDGNESQPGVSLSSGPVPIDWMPVLKEFDVPCNWGTNPRLAFQWVQSSFFAEMFRLILGNGFRWDKESARAFYRAFQRGKIQPLDILTGSRVTSSPMARILPASVTSLKFLVRYWEAIINRLNTDERSTWHIAARFISEKQRYYGPAPYSMTDEASRGISLWEQSHGDAGVIKIYLDDMPRLSETGHDEWVTRELMDLEAHCPQALSKALESANLVAAANLVLNDFLPASIVEPARPVLRERAIVAYTLSENLGGQYEEILSEIISVF